MEELNILHQMNELKKILSYSKNIGFFFGAGTSCAFGLPNIDSLTSETKHKLYSESQTLFNKASQTVKEVTGQTSVTIEDVLNYIRQIRDITHGKEDKNFGGISGKQALELDTEICKNIFEIIREKEENADIEDLRRFFAWYNSANQNYIKEIYTTNYDMLLEMAMEANYIPYFDGFVGAFEPFFNPEYIDSFPSVSDSTGSWLRLWKIHGSLNWAYKNANSSRSARIVRVGKLDNPECELMIYPSREKYSLSRKEPFIAYFDRLKKYLLKGELLFIVSGYSFSDQHINEVILNCLRQNSRLYTLVMCYEDSQVEDMEMYASSHLNLCVMGPHKAIVNGKKYSWVFDDKDEEKDGYEYFWNKADKSFILGDFKKLIEFFIDSSGKRSIIEEAIHEK